MEYLYLDENGIEDGYDTTFLFIYYLQKKTRWDIKSNVNIEYEYRRLKALGVKFTMKPTQTGRVKVAVFDDTSGNLIQIAEQ